MSYDAWGAAWGTPSAWGIAWAHSNVVPVPPPVYPTPPTIYPQGPLNPSLTTAGTGAPQEWRIELPRLPVERKPVFRRNMENRDRADIEDITQILQFLEGEP